VYDEIDEEVGYNMYLKEDLIAMHEASNEAWHVGAKYEYETTPGVDDNNFD
jgi:hypothetical protein